MAVTNIYDGAHHHTSVMKTNLDDLKLTIVRKLAGKTVTTDEPMHPSGVPPWLASADSDSVLRTIDMLVQDEAAPVERDPSTGEIWLRSLTDAVEFIRTHRTHRIGVDRPDRPQLRE